MTDVLAEICARKRQTVAERMRTITEASLRHAAAQAPPPRGFARRLRAAVGRGQYGLIAEIKKASPSRGLIRQQFDPAAIAHDYRKGGATCLSVLTDGPYFQGEDEHLTAARQAVDLPVLRKDFMVDPYQVFESRGIGADAILIIMAAVDDAVARALNDTARALGMDVLIEVHDEAELARALDIDDAMLGINNRDLKTLKTDLGVTERLAPMVPSDRLLVAESGLETSADLARMSRRGAHCFLVGTSLMAQTDVAAATRALLGDATVSARQAGAAQ